MYVAAITPGADVERLWLAKGVHGAAVDDDMVFLDVRTGRYLCLADGALRIHRSPDGQISVDDPELADELHAGGFIVSGQDHPPSAMRALPAPTSSALCWTYPPPRLNDAAPLIRALADVSGGYRGRAFEQILTGAGPVPTGTVEPTPALMAAVDRFHRWIPFAPMSAKCLLRAFLLRRNLVRQGLNAHWVFGVATWPFSAHCWLQAGPVVLDDTVERVSRYTPILVA